MCTPRYRGRRIFLTSESHVRFLHLPLGLVLLFRLWHAVWVMEYNPLFNGSFVCSGRYYIFFVFYLATAAVSAMVRVRVTSKSTTAFYYLSSRPEEVARLRSAEVE